MSFDTAFAQLIAPGEEGAYSTDPSDPGNWTGGYPGVGELKGTKYGISAASYPRIDIENLTPDGAKAIYFTDFWTRLNCNSLPAPLASALFKCAVNIGVKPAARILQGAISVAADSVIGQETVARVRSLNSDFVLSAFLGDVALRYTRDAGFVHDGRGWLRRVSLVAIQSGREQ